MSTVGSRDEDDLGCGMVSPLSQVLPGKYAPRSGNVKDVIYKI